MKDRGVEFPDGVKWIWFDLDDTLYDFMASSHIALREVYDKYGLDHYFADEEDWFEMYHRHNSAMWKLYNAGEITQQKLRYDRFFLPLQEGGVPDDENRRLNPLLDKDYLHALGATGLLVPGADRVLRHLKKRGYKIGILSNGFSGVQHQKLRSSGIEPLIDCVVLSDDVGVNKPDRRIYDHALQLSGATPRESVMIGDNPATDIAGAVNAGWNAVLFAPDCNKISVEIEGREISVAH
ncbi:MAG: YjjG family noncanonical pyrimidine nucleotidase, partial [Muribaculaceae bacterium]|nr:YjjG family noncanonical pyrimidine nucleotidase [Muribaculaceae bacterium]